MSINDTTSLFSSRNEATIYGLPETKEEPESETWRTDKYVDKEGVMLLWNLPFLHPMASYAIQQLSVVTIHRGSVTSWLRQGIISLLMKTSFMMLHLSTTAPLILGKIQDSRNCHHIYSPFLNIVEQRISALKAAIKVDISRPQVQQQMNNREEARRQGNALGHHRTQLRLQALQRNVSIITPAKCGQWFRFMQTYLHRCLNREQIEG